MRGKACALVLLAASIASGGGLPPASSRETVCRTINTWPNTCAGNSLCWSDMTTQWYNQVTDDDPPPFGLFAVAWIKDGNYIDSNSIVDSDFVDEDFVDWGRDNWNDRPDGVDLSMAALHGFNSTGNRRWFGRVRTDEAGDGNCNAWQGSMELGEAGGDAEFLHLSSCVSMDMEDWHPEWSQTFRGIHQINGFHGLMYIFCNGSDYPPRYRNFAWDSFFIPISLAWLDNMYDVRSGSANDQCPISRGVGVGGDGKADCWDRMFTERYLNVHNDPVNPTWHGVMWVTPCTPASAPTLPTR